MAEIFTESWARAWARRINENERYKKAAANWEGALAMVMTADPARGIPAERAVVADLWHGDCRGAKAAAAEDLAAAPFVIQAAPAVWRDVLAGDVEPIFGLLRGKLKLTRGSVFALVPYAAAAKELVASAARVETTFPAGWE